MNRADRRRQDKPQAIKDSEEKKYLEQAEKELLADIEHPETSPLDEFLARLVVWQQAETQRNLAKEWYGLMSELKSDEKNAYLKQYADSKKKQEVMETKLVDSLVDMTKEEQELALTKQFVIPGLGIMNCPRFLSGKLRQILTDKTKEK